MCLAWKMNGRGGWRSACRRLCITPVGLALETMCDGHFGNGSKMLYARSSFRIKPWTRSKEELGLRKPGSRLACCLGGSRQMGIGGRPNAIEYEVHCRSFLPLARIVEWSVGRIVRALSQFHDLFSSIPPGS